MSILEGGSVKNLFRAWNGGPFDHPQMAIGGYPVGNQANGSARVRILSNSTTGNSAVNGLTLHHVDSDGGGNNGLGNYISFWSESSVNNTHAETGSVTSAFSDAADTSKDGYLSFSTLGPNASAGSNAATEKMRILSSGYVGIGTTNPTQALHVNGSIRFNGRIYGSSDTDSYIDVTSAGAIMSGNNRTIIEGSKGSFHYVQIGSSSELSTGRINAHNRFGFSDATPDGRVEISLSGSTSEPIFLLSSDDDNNGDLLTVDGSGNVGIGTNNPNYKLHVVGSAGKTTGTSWTNISDARLKDVKGRYNKSLDAILGLKTVRYSYKENNELGFGSNEVIVGFVAQDVQTVIPEAVKEREDGYLELNVDPIHWATVNAVQELHGMCQATDEDLRNISKLSQQSKRDIASLKEELNQKDQRIEALEKESKQLKDRLDRIEKLLSK